MYKCITLFLFVVPLLLGQSKLGLEIYFRNSDVVRINNITELMWKEFSYSDMKYLYKSEWSLSKLESQRIDIDRYEIPPNRIVELEFYDYTEEWASGVTRYYRVKFIIKGRTGRIEEIDGQFYDGFFANVLKAPDINRGELDFDYEKPKAEKKKINILWRSNFEGFGWEEYTDVKVKRIVFNWH